MTSRTARLMMAFWFLTALIAIPHTPTVTHAATNCSDEAATGIPQAECEALVTLYTSTNGPN